MSDFQKLIQLREFTSQRMDLSSEEQDNIYLKISLDLLESKQFNESIETLEYMTSWWREDWLRKIIENFIIKDEYRYSLNAIALLNSSLEKDSLYLQLIKRKLSHWESDMLVLIKSMILNEQTREIANEYIEDPDKIIQENIPNMDIDKSLKIQLENMICISDAKRKAKICDIDESISILRRIFGKENNSFSENAISCFSIAIKNATSQNEINRITYSYKQTQLQRNKPQYDILSDLKKKEQELINLTNERHKLSKLSNVLHILLNRDELLDYELFLNNEEQVIYIELIRLIKKCPLITIDRKLLDKSFICYIGWDKFVYRSKAGAKKLRSKSLEVYRWKIQEFLLKKYIEPNKDAR